MTTNPEALAELLERATRLEEPAETKADTAVEEAPSVEELQARIAELEDEVFALSNSTPAGEVEEPAEAAAAAAEPELEVVEEPVGLEEPGELAAPVDAAPVEEVDLVTPTAEEKAMGGWAPCPVCGSANVDEYADGTARCEDCGAALTRTEGKDFDDDDLEVKDYLDELELIDMLTPPAEEPAEGKDDDADLETKGGPAGGDPDDITALMERRARLGA
jgi:hypothetical protein